MKEAHGEGRAGSQAGPRGKIAVVVELDALSDAEIFQGFAHRWMHGGLSRRAFLQRSLILAGAVFVDRAIGPLWRQWSDAGPGAETVEALAEVLVPWTDNLEAVRRHARSQLARHAQRDPGMAMRYRAAAAHLNRLARRRCRARSFTQLTPIQRQELLLRATGGTLRPADPVPHAMLEDHAASERIRAVSRDLLSSFLQGPDAPAYLGVPLV
jgi:hypothetical protein